MMNRQAHLVIALLAALVGGCATNDFKVVDALHKGMTRPQADAVIQSYGFRLDASTTRPSDGWPDDSHTLLRMALRAQYVEATERVTIQTVDYYGVQHGFMGFGWLFLFYDKDDVLMDFYRKQIN